MDVVNAWEDLLYELRVVAGLSTFPYAIFAFSLDFDMVAGGRSRMVSGGPHTPPA